MSVEQLHREITSGRSGAASALGEDLVRHTRTLDDSCNDVLDGMTGVSWPAGLAAIAFITKSQGLYASISTASWRMYRLGDALTDVAREYDRVVREADRLLRTWEALDPEQRKRPATEGSWLRALIMLKSDWSTYLADLAADLTDDDERQEMPDEGGGSSERQSDEEWVVRGAEQDFLSHLRNGTRRGPRIPNSYINSGETYVQQGLAHHEGQYFMTSYGYDDSRKEGSDFEASNLKTSNLTTIDSETGEATGSVNLAGPRSFPDSQPQHSGGVTVMNGYVYVVSTEYGPEPEIPVGDRDPQPHLYKYKLSDIENAGPGETVRAESRFPVPASSYISNDGENVYLGQFSDEDDGPGRLYTVTPESMNTLEDRGVAMPLPSRETPSGVNGATVLGDRIFYSQNGGRDKPSTIIEDDLKNGDRTEIETGSLVEENTVAGDDLAWLSEAGAEAYSHRDDESAAEDDNDDLWGQSHMTVGPGGAGGVDIEAEPQSLRSASRTFADVSDSVSGVRGDTRGVELPASTLGEVAGASTFSAAVGTQAGAFSDDLGDAETEAETVFSGLRWCADGYDLADHESFSALDTFSALLGG